MYSFVLIDSQHCQPPGPSSEQAYYEEFAIVPFAGVRRAIRTLGGGLLRALAPGAAPFRDRQPTSVLR